MSYQIVIKRQAQKKLKRINTGDKNRIAEKIWMLGEDPIVSSSSPIPEFCVRNATSLFLLEFFVAV